MNTLRTRTSSYNDCLMTNEKEQYKVEDMLAERRAEMYVGGVDEQGAPGVKAGN